MDERAAGIGARGLAAIERGLQNADHVLVGGIVGTLDADRRHRPGAELADDLLPHLRVRRGVGDVEGVERQVAGLQAAVVAGDAVFANDRRRWRRACGGGRRALRGGLWMLRRDRGQPDADREEAHASGEGARRLRCDWTPPWCEHSPQHPVSMISAVRRRCPNCSGSDWPGSRQIAPVWPFPPSLGRPSAVHFVPVFAVLG